MTVSFRTAITLLAAALVQGVASRDDTVGNFTLIRCPGGGNGTGCARVEKEEVVFPADDYVSPGYIDGFGPPEFVVDYDAPHLLTWDKVDDEPRNLTISLGGYEMKKVITTERELYITFSEMATKLLPNKDRANATEMVLGGSTQNSDSNAIGFMPLNPPYNHTYLGDIEGIKDFYLLPGSFYGYFHGIAHHRRQNFEEALNKKWRIGVGVGVGVGVPLLMGLSYFLGIRKGKKPKKEKPKKNIIIKGQD